MASAYPLDGRVPSQNELLPAPGATAPTLDPTTVFHVVSPGNNQFGDSYRVSFQTLLNYFLSQVAPASGAVPIQVPTLLNGINANGPATAASPYVVRPSDTRIIVNKVTPSPTSITLPLAVNMQYNLMGVLIKDVAGTAGQSGNAITITTTAGEAIDGLGSITIANDYGWVGVAPYSGGGVVLNPSGTGSAWYQFA